MADDLKIIIGTQIDQSARAISDINSDLAKLSEKINKLSVKIDIDDSQVKKISDQLSTVQKAAAKGVNVAAQPLNGTAFTSVDEAIKKYSQLGQVIVNKTFNPATKELEKFNLSLTKADGTVEKLAFKMQKLDTGNGLETVFGLDKITEIDKKQELIEKQLQESQKTRLAIQKQEQKQLEDQNKEREKALQEEQKIRNKINELVAKEKEKTDQLEHQLNLYKQQAAINVQNMTRRFGDSIDKGSLEDYLKNVNSLNTQTPNLRKEMDNLGMSFKQISSEARTSGSHVVGFSESIKIALTRMLQWGIAGTAIFGSLRQLKEGVSYVTELNNALNEIRIVTGKSEEQVNKLAMQYNKTAKEMSVSTKELASVNVDLFRQGLSEKETQERTDAIVKYAKISSISLEQSNKIITATMNATGESASKVIDIFSYLGDATASGADEIGEAMQRLASTSDGLGVSLEKAASWVAVISSKTRESASVIGNALKSVESRYTSIKEKGFNSEDATDINQVTKALTAAGIQATTADGQLRDFTQVLDELGMKYKDLDAKTQNYLMTTLGGTYQMNRLRALMDGYSDSVKLYNQTLSAGGIANQKFEIWQESSAAKIDKLRATWEGFWQNSLDSGIINSVIGLLTRAISSFDSLGNVIALVSGILIVFKSRAIADFIMGIAGSTKALLGFQTGMRSTVAASGAATSAINATTVAMSSFQRVTGIIGLVITAGSLLYTVMNSIESSAEAAAEKIESLNQKYSDHESQLKNVLSYYEQNHEAINKDSDVKDQLLELQNKLVDTFGKEAESLDLVNGKYDEQIVKLKELNKADIGNKIKDAQILVDSLKETQYGTPNIGAGNGLKSMIGVGDSTYSVGGNAGIGDLGVEEYYKELLKLQDQVRAKNTEIFAGSKLIPQNSKEWSNALSSVQDELKKIKPIYDQIIGLESLKKAQIQESIGQQQNFNSAQMRVFTTLSESFKSVPLEEYGNKLSGIVGKIKETNSKDIKEIVNKLKEIPSIQNEGSVLSALNSLNTTLAQPTKALEKFSDQLDNIKGKFIEASKEVKPYNQLIQDLKEGKQMTADEVAELAVKEQGFMDTISIENGIITVNIDAVEKLRDAKAKSVSDEIENSKKLLEIKKADTITQLRLYGAELGSIERINQAKARYYELEGDNSRSAKAIDTTIDSIDSIDKQIKQLESLNIATQNGLKTIGMSEPKKDSGSSSEAQLKDALDQQDMTKELISSFNEEYKIRQKIIDSQERQIKITEKQKDYNKAIQQTVDLISEQEKSIVNLQSAQDKMEDEASRLRSTRPDLDTDSWFDSNNEMTLSYVNFLNTFAAKTKEVQNDSSKSVEQRNKEIGQIKNEQKEIQTLFDHLSLLKKGWQSNSDEILVVRDAIDKSKDSIRQYAEDAKKAALEANKDWMDITKKAIEEATDAYKEYYKQQEDLAVDIIEKQKEAEEERHKARQKNLDTEMDKYKESIDLINKQIDREDETDDFNKNLSKAQKERQKLLDEYNKRVLDNSIDGKSKAKELQKQIADKDEDIEKMQKDRTKDLRKDSLKDMLDQKQKEVDAAKEADNTIYESVKNGLDKAKEATEKYWKGIIDNEQTYSKIREGIIFGHTSSVLSEMETFKSTLNSQMSLIGEGITQNLIAKLELAKKMLGGINYNTTATNPLGMSTEDFAAYLQNKKNYEEGVMPNASASANAMLRQKYGIPSDDYSYDYLKSISGITGLKTGGYTGLWGSDGKLAVLHEKELVLNKLDTSNILQAVDLARNFASMIKIPDFSSIKQSIANSSPVYNLTMNIASLAGTKEGGKTAFNEIVSGLKQLGAQM